MIGTAFWLWDRFFLPGVPISPGRRIDPMHPPFNMDNIADLLNECNKILWEAYRLIGVKCPQEE
jgi:hypothetical protein